MSIDFSQLSQMLKQRGIDEEAYRTYLEGVLLHSFSTISQGLKQKGIDLHQYLSYLQQQKTRLVPIVQSESGLNLEDPLRDQKAFYDLRRVCIKLLVDKKIEVNELNQLLQELPEEKIKARQVLQVLLKQRKIQVEEFLELEQGIWTEVQELEQPYRLRIEDGHPEFYLEKSTKTQFLGPYQLLEELARGGMGIVYKAYHPSLNQIFALKVLIAGEDASEQAIKRFHREIQSTAKLRHPGIVQITDSGQEGGKHYFVMEYVEGKTLDQKIRESKLTHREGLKVIQKTLDALHYAHQQGIIHRDLKPENIFITKEGDPKIGDFGLARDLSSDTASQKLTQSGAIMGTPTYMSPEQAKGEANKVGPTSDVYSVGVCLYQILTSKCPFDAPTIHSLVEKIIHDEVFPPSRLNAEVHQDLDTIVLKALEKNVEKRYQSAKAFALDLGRFLEGHPIYARPASPMERFTKWGRRNRQLFFFLLFAFLLLVSVVGYLQWNRFQERQEKAQERKQQFQQLYQQAQQQIEKSQQLSSEKVSSFSNIELLFNALHLLEQAKVFSPQNQMLLDEKKRVGKELVGLACEAEEYHLASYVANELQDVLEELEISQLKIQIENAQQKLLKQHLERFEYWVEELRQHALNQGKRERALLEINKMREKEIFQKLLNLVEEGTRYFLESDSRSATEDAFYETMAIALGWLENPSAGETLYRSLLAIFEKIASFPKEKQPPEEIRYLIALTQALGNSKTPEMAKKVQTLRQKMGENTKFWKETALAFQILGTLDGLASELLLDSESYVSQGILLQKAKKDQEAIILFNKALELDPANADAYLNRGVSRLNENDLKGSLKDYNDSIRIRPKDLAYLKRARLYQTLKEEDRAIEDYNRAIQINPNYALGYNNRASLLMKNGDTEGALRDFTKTIQLSPKFYYAYYGRGIIMHKKGEKEEAKKDLQVFLKLTKENESKDTQAARKQVLKLYPELENN